VGVGNLAAIEVAGNGIETFGNIGDVKLSIDFRRMHCGAAFEQ
jgi:hypothetical protein